MNKSRQSKWIQVGLAIVIVLGINFIISAKVSAAEKKEKKMVEYKLNSSFDDNLLLFKGKYVRVILSSGQSLSGYVKDVKEGLLHLEKLGGGRDYHDALVRVKDISAMDAKFRGFK
ncbi:MAG: hypothetical protein JSW04_09660 [Desulfobacterales bacterium]|nr:MAG: hypothetical protein JSW04_09660 [Desulfobacterales bacterium]